MNKKNLVKAASLIFLLGLVVMPQAVGALSANDLGLGYATATGLTSTDIRETAARIINVALGLLGIIAVIIILIGGFKWMTAGGNEEKVGEAKKLITAGIIGLVVIITAYAIAAFVISSLITATT
jgi:Zn-dependent protease with chaperone function